MTNTNLERRYPQLTIINDKRRYAQVQYDGVWFELDKKNPVPFESILSGYNDIYEAYNRPSTVIVNIWNAWKKWFTRNDGICTICSTNCNFFSIEGFFTDRSTGKRYYAYITYANHKLYEVGR